MPRGIESKGQPSPPPANSRARIGVRVHDGHAKFSIVAKIPSYQSRRAAPVAAADTTTRGEDIMAEPKASQTPTSARPKRREWWRTHVPLIHSPSRSPATGWSGTTAHSAATAGEWNGSGSCSPARPLPERAGASVPDRRYRCFRKTGQRWETATNGGLSSKGGGRKR